MPSINTNNILMRLVRDVNSIQSSLRRVVSNLPLFDIANENSPAQITTDQNNYVIGNYDILKLSSSVAVSITGFTGGLKGRYLRIFNVGSYAITLMNQNLSSSAANRLKFSSGLDSVIAPGSNILIYYDSNQNRWVGGDSISSGPVFMLLVNEVDQTIPFNTIQKPNFGTVILDQYDFWDNANNRIVIPFDGIFSINCGITWEEVSPDQPGHRFALYYLNGSQTQILDQIDNVVNGLARMDMNYISEFSTGDIIEVYVQQAIVSGNATILDLRLSLFKI